MKSELELIAAAGRIRQVMDAIYDMLAMMESKSGYEQRHGETMQRCIAQQEEEEKLKASIAKLKDDYETAKERINTAKAEADAIITQANEQASQTRIAAQHEADTIAADARLAADGVIADAKAKAGSIVKDYKDGQARLEKLESTIADREKELADLAAKVDSLRADAKKMLGL